MIPRLGRSSPGFVHLRLTTDIRFDLQVLGNPQVRIRSAPLRVSVHRMDFGVRERIGPDGAAPAAKEVPVPALDPGHVFETGIDAPAAAPVRARSIAQRVPGWIALDREVEFR